MVGPVRHQVLGGGQGVAAVVTANGSVRGTYLLRGSFLLQLTLDTVSDEELLGTELSLADITLPSDALGVELDYVVSKLYPIREALDAVGAFVEAGVRRVRGFPTLALRLAGPAPAVGGGIVPVKDPQLGK